MTTTQTAAINAHHNALIATASARLASAVEDFNAGYGEDYPGAIEDLRRGVTDAREARAFALAD